MKKTHISLIGQAVVAAVAIFGFQAAGAATLGVIIYQPDLSSPGATIDYAFVDICTGTSNNGATGSGACGTTNGLNGPNKITYSTFDESLSSGTLTIAMSGNQTLDAYGTGLDFITGGSYSLVANFDGTGSFIDGTVTALGTASVSNDPNFQSGTIVTGDLTDFGFGGTGSAGTLDFYFDNVGGDFAPFYGGYAGIVVTTTSLTPATGNWDTGGLDFQADFSASSANVNTVVPIPAAAWLFGSGLLGLAGMARRRRRETV